MNRVIIELEFDDKPTDADVYNYLNNYADNEDSYEDLNQVPKDKMLCGVCYEENEDE
jgi:hypothetical protein